MPLYLTLMRVDRTKINDWQKHLNTLLQKTSPGIKPYYVANVFGEWDNCFMFESKDNDCAMDFVQNNLAKIPGVNLTYTMPTTLIKEYYKNRKK